MSRANLFKSVEVQFPRPDPAKALAPVAESVSGADGFDHCIFCSGPAATKTRRGVLRCRKHAKECIDPDCKARRGHRTFEKVTKGLTFQDSSKAELLCDHCRNEFFRRLAGFDDQAEEHTGIARNFFVYRYTDAGDPKYGMTHTPTRRRNERSGGKTASRVVDSVLELYDGEKSFKARARTMDWLSPTFGRSQQGVQARMHDQALRSVGKGHEPGPPEHGSGGEMGTPSAGHFRIRAVRVRCCRARSRAGARLREATRPEGGPPPGYPSTAAGNDSTARPRRPRPCGVYRPNREGLCPVVTTPHRRSR